MNKVIASTDITDMYVAEFESAMGLYAGKNAQLNTIRREAMESFVRMGFPTTKNEEWKYTNLKTIATEHFKLCTPGVKQRLTAIDIQPFLIAQADVHVLVFENGLLNAGLSNLAGLPSKCLVDSLANQFENPLVAKHFTKYADSKANPLVALNTAFAFDGIFIHIPDNVIVEKPIHLLFVNDSRVENIVSYPRVLCVAGKNSHLALIESYHTTTGNGFTNAVTEIIAGENADVDLYKVQLEGEDAQHINFTQVDQEKNSNCSVHTITLSGGLVRNNLHYLLNDTGCETHMYGLYLLNGNQVVDNHTLVDHAMPNCFSNELYKGIVDDNATAVFNGKIMVRPDAQKTNAYQSNKTILLSDNATINTKPQLEIFADDVKCSHGATTGRLDNEALFYLRSRGIGEEQARAMLIYAFAGDVLNNVKIEALKSSLMHLLAERFQQEEE